MKLDFIKSADGSQAGFKVTDAKNQKIEGYGTLTGNGLFALTRTDDTDETVFSVYNTSGTSQLTMDSNDENYSFTGTGFDVTFDKTNAAGYNVELNTTNSLFDFTKSNSCAFVWNNGSNTTVNLSGTPNNYLGAELLESGDGTSQSWKVYNNIVYDNGSGNTYNSDDTSVTRFQTLANSYGATIKGSGNDAFYIGGMFGEINGLNENSAGYNYFQTDSTSIGNSFVGGMGENRYDDFGSFNTYIGANYIDGTTSNYISFNGYYGLGAKIGDGVINYNGGSYNIGFNNTDEGTDQTTGTTYKFSDIYSIYQNNLLSLFSDDEE